ncbi:MAG: Crp/Fnr family transcriptional regulator [candidate division NC10 bacterium]|nr:Crp/Fnr family transcriptional regulator [candidate division NC10 bacterium]
MKKRNVEPGAGFEITDALRSVPCLQGLSAAALNKLQGMARHRRLPRGAILFREGAICEEVFIITGGKVKVYRLSPDGRQQTLWVLVGGECFCFAPSFHRARYPGTAQCMTEVRVIELGRAPLVALPRSSPGLAGAVIGCLCHRLTTTASLLEEMSTQPVRHRLARFLLTLAETRGVKTPDGILLDDGWTHDELASCVGTVREVVSRTLKQLAQEGLVRSRRRCILLPDPARLEKQLRLRRPAKNPLS